MPMFKDNPETDAPARTEPAYKLRQKLADMDLKLKHPRLDKRWRKRIAGPSDARNAAGERVVRGRKNRQAKSEHEDGDEQR